MPALATSRAYRNTILEQTSGASKSHRCSVKHVQIVTVAAEAMYVHIGDTAVTWYLLGMIKIAHVVWPSLLWCLC